MNDGPGHLGGTLRYLVAATHWSLLAGSGLIIGAGVALVARWPEALWPVHGTALGLMVGMAAVAVDERCATVVDASPRPLWWRTAVRSAGPLALVLFWATAHWALRAPLPDRLDVLILQGAVACGIGFGLATAARASGRSEPGVTLAAAAVPLVAGAALARPFEPDLPLFPVWPHEDWDRALLIWTVLGTAAALVAAQALWRDARPRRNPGVTHRPDR